MEDKKMEIITIKDIDYAILDEIDDYIYTVNVNDGNDVKMFKIDESSESIKELTEEEQSVALVKFYEKHKDLVSTNE